MKERRRSDGAENNKRGEDDLSACDSSPGVTRESPADPETHWQSDDTGKH